MLNKLCWKFERNVQFFSCWTLIGLILTVPLVNSSNSDEFICGDTDIRNSASNLMKLEKCTVIEGYLQILLIDKGKPADYENFTFPQLREITGFVLLYRAFGLKSLKRLFPNLSVIRGAKLFHNYALVVYEMMNLEEIGLVALTDILRGSVYVAKNPQLCFVDTIDWDLIAKRGKGGHFIKNNKDSNQCPSECLQSCPARRNSDRPNTRLCWNQQNCQKVCDEDCGMKSCSNFSTSKCCSEECLGGCSKALSSSSCFVCSNVVYNGKCSKSCPPQTYEYAGRRCITDFECKNLPSGKLDGNEKINWKIFENRQCLQECPPGYMEDENDKNSCVKCGGSCPKLCKGILVDSAADAQELKGCTRITGALEIQISGGKNIVQELEENLNMIEEVDDFVKVVRSFPLISLNFLKNLRKIHGNKKENNNYSLLVYDNDNLQEIMHFKNRSHKLQIVSGKIFFHLNPKLCLSKIKELKTFANLPEWEEKDVSSTSNGDQMPCDIKLMWASVTLWTPRDVLLKWENVQRKLGDHRSILGYIISYKEAPFQNVTLFDGRDACGGDTWKVIDVPASHNENSTSEKFLLNRLKPFTQYAVYIRTYIVRTEDEGAQSNIMYFKTNPDVPSIPLDLNAISFNPHELVISWLPPLRPNGNVTHYEITGTLLKDYREIIDRRDYCKQHITFDKSETSKKDPLSPTEKTIDKTDFDPDACPGSKEKVDLKSAAEEAQFENMFEDMIHNRVFVKRPKSKRSVENKYAPEMNLNPANDGLNSLNSLNLTNLNNTSSSLNETVMELAFNLVSYNNSIVVKNLTHFSTYEIEVKACQNPDEVGIKLCSSKAILAARTAPLGKADIINFDKIVVKLINNTNVYIKWEEPEFPNGLVVTFELEYHRTNIKNYKPSIECINYTQYIQKKGHTLTGLAPGNYKLRLRATTLAGFGNWTEFRQFVIADSQGGLSVGVVAAIATCAIILVIICLGVSLFVIFRKKYGQDIPNRVLYASVNPEYLSTVYVPDEWEVPREKIKIIKELGQGSFGMVYSGIAKNIVKGEPETKCAIKTVNESATFRERIEFLNEASVMKAFTSFHVLKLLGVVSKGQPTLVIMELMANGDLKAYLRSLRPDYDDPQNNSRHPPTLETVLRMASEIADGMAYLSAKKFVHRDLAARNCMVGEDLVVKIGDFGMTRDVYETDYYRKGGKGLLPVRWMAPESLKDGVFTSLSDTWSYGVVLWEMATLASQPYQGLSNEQVLKYVIDGGIMERPEACPDKLYDLMRRCWQQNPKKRPSFTQLVTSLLPYVRQDFDKNSFYFSQDADRLLNTPDAPHLTNDQDVDVDIENIPPTTPLRTPSTHQLNNLEGEFGGGNRGSKAYSVHSNESGSKGLSSGGSSESKVSSHSANGGLVNGHHRLPVV